MPGEKRQNISRPFSGNEMLSCKGRHVGHHIDKFNRDFRPCRDNRGAIITIKSCFHWTIVAIKAKSHLNLSLLSR